MVKEHQLQDLQKASRIRTKIDGERKMGFRIHFDSCVEPTRGRAQLLYDLDTHDLKVSKVKPNGYHIINFTTMRNSRLQGFHFAREDDKFLDGSRQECCHCDIPYVLPTKIRHFPKQEGIKLDSYPSKILDEETDQNMIYRIVCIFFVLGHGFHLVRGMSDSSSEFNEIPDKYLEH